MSRKVLDNIALSRIKTKSEEERCLYLTSSKFQGNVTDKTGKKVGLEKSKSGIKPVGLVSKLNDIVNAMELSDGEGEIVWTVNNNVKRESADIDEIRLLKSLAVYQVSSCDILSAIVGLVFQQVMRSIMNGTHVRVWAPSPNFTEEQAKAFKVLTEFVDSKLH